MENKSDVCTAQKRLQEFPYERIAMAGEEMPEGLKSEDQQMFLSLRLLYSTFKKGLIDRETARKEKVELLREYKANLIVNDIARNLAKKNIETEAARIKYRKNRTLENADAIILAFEGVPVTFNEEAL